MDLPTREVYWNVHPYVLLMYILALASVASLVYGFYLKYKLVSIGKPDIKLDRWPERARAVFLWEARFFRRKLAGPMHFVILWGAVVLFIGTVVVFVHEDLRIPIMTGSFYLVFQSLFLDLAGLLAIVGIIVAGVQRYILKTKRLQNGTLADGLLLGLLLLLLVTGFLAEGLRIVATQDPWAMWSPVGLAFGSIISPVVSTLGASGLSPLPAMHQGTWLIHMAAAFATIGIIPYTKLGHLVLAPINVFLRPLGKSGVPKPIDFENETVLGVAEISDFTTKHLLDLEACTACGRCEERCPATKTNKPLSPRQLILNLRTELRSKNGVKPVKQDDEEAAVDASRQLIPRVVGEEVIWSCTTCLACQTECPAHIEPVSKIVEMRRHQVMDESELPQKLADVSTSLDKRGHPFPGVSTSRQSWMQELDGVDSHLNAKGAGLLYWVGCSAALNERTTKIAAALYQILHNAGIEFRILGGKEPCCGDPARRIGNEYQFEAIAKKNLAMFEREGITSIVTPCPHCFSAFKNDYSQFDGKLNVVHHSQFLKELMTSGKLSVAGNPGKRVTYHDPCYLGRYNGAYDDARSVLKETSLIELPSSRSFSLCCGGGGGRFWIDEQPQYRVSYLRMQEVMDSGADTLVTACPFCTLMLDEAAKSKAKGKLEVMDLSEWVIASLASR